MYLINERVEFDERFEFFSGQIMNLSFGNLRFYDSAYWRSEHNVAYGRKTDQEDFHLNEPESGLG